MKYNELTANRQARAKRVGRGIAAGRGKTAGRGTKGQGARKSGGVRPGFEGGQTPIYMKIPKLRGFNSKRLPAEVVFTGQLDGLKPTVIDCRVLHDAGLITSPHCDVKIIVNGELKSKKTVKLPKASAAAIKLIEKAGGSFTPTARLARPAAPKTAA